MCKELMMGPAVQSYIMIIKMFKPEVSVKCGMKESK
jgi:hypothetical protein